MKPSLLVEVATRPPAARIALRGTLTHSGAQRTMRACESVPPEVRVVHLDLRRLRFFDVSALEGLLTSLRLRGLEDGGVLIVTRSLRHRGP